MCHFDSQVNPDPQFVEVIFMCDESLHRRLWGGLLAAAVFRPVTPLHVARQLPQLRTALFAGLCHSTRVRRPLLFFRPAFGRAPEQQRSCLPSTLMAG